MAQFFHSALPLATEGTQEFFNFSIFQFFNFSILQFFNSSILGRLSRSFPQNPAVSVRGSCVGSEPSAGLPATRPPLLGAHISDTPSSSLCLYPSPQLPSAHSSPTACSVLGASRSYGASGRTSRKSAASNPYACTKRSTP